MYKNIKELEEKEKYALNKIQSSLWFKSDDLKGILKCEWMTYDFLKKWIKEKKVKRYPFYIYSPIDPKTKEPKINIFEALCQIHETAYLCDFTAARFHHLNVPEDNCIYIASKKRFRQRSYEGRQLKYKYGSWLEELVYEDEKRYTSYTRTVLEIIKDFHKNMTLEELYNFLNSVRTLETEKMINILEALKNRVLIQKIGWFVDAGLLKADQPDKLIVYCLKRRNPNNLVLCKEVKGNGVFNKKWKIMVP